MAPKNPAPSFLDCEANAAAAPFRASLSATNKVETSKDALLEEEVVEGAMAGMSVCGEDKLNVVVDAITDDTHVSLLFFVVFLLFGLCV